MAWIESHDDVWEHHKTVRLCAILKIGRAAAVGHLHGLWHFVLKNAWRDADLSLWLEAGPSEIERAVWWDGEKGALVTALQHSGYMDGSVVHGWLERAGRLVGDRLRNESRRKTYVKRTANVRKSVATLPNPTLPNPTLPNQHGGGGFESFWEAYPRHINKAGAFKAWMKLRPDAEMLATILAAIASQSRSEQWTKDGGQFIPHPTTWLNQRRWEDRLKPMFVARAAARVPANIALEEMKRLEREAREHPERFMGASQVKDPEEI